MATYPAWLQDMAAYIKNPNIYMYGRWNHPPSAMEGGVDLASPGGTPVYALATGPIEGAGNFWHSANLYTPGSGNPGYGVITERVNIPGHGLNDLYYQHIQLAPGIQTCYADNCNGQVVHQGQLLGWVVPGVNEVEVGLNADWGGVWGVNHPNAWATDPRPAIASLMQNGGGPPITDPSQGTTSTTSGTGAGPSTSNCDPNAPVVGYFCNAQNQLTLDIASLQGWATQAGIVLFGAILVIGALFLVFKG